VTGVPRFYLDEDIPHSAAEIGRGLGLDVVAAAERGLNAVPDGVHLAAAASEGRVMVTYNRDDFLAETRDAFALGRPHAGVLILTWKLPRQAAPIAHALARWAADHGPMQPYTVDFLSR
jgi:hypothetical protein